MRDWSPERVARAAGAEVVGVQVRAQGPARVVIDSRTVEPGDLFVGLSGERQEGGAYAAEALAAGAWGVLVGPDDATALQTAGPGAVLVHANPLSALQSLARSWRRELGAKVVAITGSTGKTSTKDILGALLASQMRVAASPENFNTKIGLPLAVLGAPAGTEVLVLEMAMRGPGQIAELTAIAEPDVGVILNIGPVHLEGLGSLEAIAAAKAELITGLAPGATIVIPADEPLLDPYLRGELRTVAFGAGGDIELAEQAPGGEVVILDRTPANRSTPRHAPARAGVRSQAHAASADAEPGRQEMAAGRGGEAVVIRLRPSFAQAHNLRNLLPAVAAARAVGITPAGDVRVRFSALRGERHVLPGGVVLIDDCYNANPMSMRAAIDDLAETADGRRVAVLGDMLELGPDSPRLHREIGEYARPPGGSALLVTVGPLAAEMRAAFAGEATLAWPSADGGSRAAGYAAARRGHRARQGLTRRRARAGGRVLGVEEQARGRDRRPAVLAPCVGSGRR